MRPSELRSPQGEAAALPWLISVDDHVIEPPNVWSDRLASKWADTMPRIERHRIGNLHFVGGHRGFDFELDPADGSGEWADLWFYDGQMFPHKRPSAAAGTPPEEITLNSITYEQMRTGCYDPKARLEDMDLGHIDGSMSFPTFPRFCGQTFLEANDLELAELCVRAYNDWMIDEWCATDPQRLIPLCIIPLWDSVLAAEEVRRVAARGNKSVCFSEVPPRLGLPSIHSGAWDPFFAACEETNTVISMHIGSSSKMPVTSQDAPAMVTTTLTFQNSCAAMVDWLFSGIFVRYPGLKIALSEGQIGWVPYVLERADDVWKQFSGWQGDDKTTPEPPSYYYYRHVYTCFFNDRTGIELLERCGEDNITFESDYPHTDSTWPNSADVALANTRGLTETQIWKILRGNAINLLDLAPEAPGTLRWSRS